MEISADWEGSFDVADAYFMTAFTDAPLLTVNGQGHVMTSSEELALSGVQGMEARGTFSWIQVNQSSGLKICPSGFHSLPGPWGDDPWTSTSLGGDCTLPFIFNGLSYSACTQQLSDPYDVDQDGRLYNGHPRCQSATGLSLCGPCSCAAAEDQLQHVQRLPSGS